MTESRQQNIRELHACVVPWREDCSLLVPGAMIAETLYHLDNSPLQHGSPWVDGGVEWRGQIVPLVTFDDVPDLPKKVTDETRRVLICHTLSYSNEHAYIALEFYRLPRLLFIDESSFSVVDESSASEVWPFVAKIDIRESIVYVLDMEKLCTII
ncbi:MAG: chemotaxis protein CheW [Pseudomonadales bacterium]|nr:chemotaxis protein CheW [Pseudomonadales bacterium]